MYRMINPLSCIASGSGRQIASKRGPGNTPETPAYSVLRDVVTHLRFLAGTGNILLNLKLEIPYEYNSLLGRAVNIV